MPSRYFLKLDQFEGPLDLLLHLIKDNEIDVFDIDIYMLSTQYLNYLRLIKFDDLSDAGDFLSMAAHLIEIKTQMLLPRPKSKDTDDGDDPRLPLQERLLLYEKFKDAGANIGKLPMVGYLVWASTDHKRLDAMVEKPKDAPVKADPSRLIVLYEQMLKNMNLRRKPSKVTIKNQVIGIETVIEQMQKRIEKLRFVMFQNLYSRFSSRYEFVINIMAMLELAKYGDLKVYQDRIFGPIWLFKQDELVEYVDLNTDLDQFDPEALAVAISELQGEKVI